MGPHPLAPEDLTSDTRFSSYSRLDKRTTRSDDGQMAQRTLQMTINLQAIRDMETTNDNRSEMAWGGAGQYGSNRESRRRRKRENLAREEKEEAVNLLAKQNGSEYQDFTSSEDAADEGWVMVDIPKLALK